MGSQCDDFGMDKERKHQKNVENSDIRNLGPDGKIHPVKVWEEEKEIEGLKGKYKIRVTVCQF